MASEHTINYLVKMLWYYYTALGTEGNIISTPLTLKDIWKVARDGIWYRMVNSTPSGKQVRYDDTTGGFFFDEAFPPLSQDEQIDIAYKYPV